MGYEIEINPDRTAPCPVSTTKIASLNPGSVTDSCTIKMSSLDGVKPEDNKEDTPILVGQNPSSLEESNISGNASANGNQNISASGPEGIHTEGNLTHPPNTPTAGIQNDPIVQEQVQADTLIKLEQLKEKLEQATDIPTILLDVSLNCLQVSTIEYLSYHLDPEGDVLTEENKVKDYRGMAEWIGLEPIFIKYVSHSSYIKKTAEVLSKWLTMETPVPNLKSFRDCMLAIDRPDVLNDMAVKISHDAVSWKMTELEATIKKPDIPRDTSWQLTRHDVVTGKETHYTCCLVYAEEDEQMVNTFTRLYKSAHSRATFFLPQFDLKHGKFVYETTAQVIEERCGGKVVFFISEYFLASDVCRFAVGFCKDMSSSTAQQGNLIPFFMTSKYEHIPRVLRGIAGIRWFQKSCRRRLWFMLTDSLLGGQIPETELELVKESMERIIEKDKEFYLSDPVYDKDTPQPGEPIPVYDPPPEVENSDDPSSRHFDPTESECLMASSLSSLERLGFESRRSNITRIRQFVRKRILGRIFNNRQRRPGPPPSDAHQPPIVLPN